MQLAARQSDDGKLALTMLRNRCGLEERPQRICHDASCEQASEE